MLEGDEFIALCIDGGDIMGEKRIWQVVCREKLMDVVNHFLETGKIEYTKINLSIAGGPDEKVSFTPPGDKIYYWAAVGRFRKRPQEIGGNIFTTRKVHFR